MRASVGNIRNNLHLLQVEASVIGRNCRIGRGAHITGCYLLDNVSVGDQAQVSHSLMCDVVSVGAHATIFPGSVLSFKVRIIKASRQWCEAYATITFSIVECCLSHVGSLAEL